MVSKELENAIQSYEDYINANGIDENVIDAYIMASQTAYKEDREYALKVSARAKEIIEQFISDLTGGNVWLLEKYQQDNDTAPYEVLEKYYEVLKLESLHIFESFIYYMERNRSYSKRFYQPRRQTLKCVVDDLQALEDKEQNRVFYGLSMPSRVGKAIAYNTHVLTQNGWN